MNKVIIAGMALEQPDKLRTTHRTANTGAVTEIEALVHGYYTQVQRLALSLLNDPDDAEDATQEVFIAAARALPDFRGDASLKTWLYTITLNHCRRVRQKRQRQQLLRAPFEKLQNWLSGAPTPEESTARRESDRHLWSAVDSLSEKHRLPFILRYVHGLTALEIAEILALNEGTVHSRLHYARRYLKQKLRE